MNAKARKASEGLQPVDTPTKGSSFVNPGEWATQQDIHPQTAYLWFRTGTLPVPARKMGKLILAGDLEASSWPVRPAQVLPKVVRCQLG